MSVVTDAAMAVMKKALAIAPDSWLPGGTPDPLIRHQHGHVGKPVSRLDGPLKVKGAARFAAEFPLDGMVHAALVFSTIPKGRIATIDTSVAQAASCSSWITVPRRASNPCRCSAARRRAPAATICR